MTETTHAGPTRIDGGQFRALYRSTTEFAVLDPREELFFARGHLLGATNMPLSRLELLVPRGIPNLETTIVVCDDGDGLAEITATRLNGLGYSQVSVLDGGLPVWALAGGAVFSGVHVRSKAFGELIERHFETPSISAPELHDSLDRGEDILLLDARPVEEHNQYCIPGAISCPSSELILRCAELAADAKQVVVHCAGRTRSIIGAQTLIDSGLFSSVRSLVNGTPGWEFEGWHTEKGSNRFLPKPAPPSSLVARASAERLREAFDIAALDHTALSSWLDGGGTRYLFDIREADEFVAGHLDGATHVPGGQLIQTTDSHIVVENSNIALVDDDGVRAVTTAMWLKRMGWQNVVTHQLDLERSDLARAKDLTSGRDPSLMIECAGAHAAHQRGAVFLDLRRSYEYRRTHVSGSYYLNRADLAADIAKVPSATEYVIVADDDDFALLVQQDLEALGRPAHILQGGLDVWLAGGHPTESGTQRLASSPVDTYFESDHFDDFQVHIREHHAYLNWEIALIDHIVGDPAARYEIEPMTR